MPKGKTDISMPESTILDTIVATKREEVARLRPLASELRDAAERASPGRGFRSALTRAGEVALLAEVKRRSPSAGEIRPGARVEEVATAYERAGAAAISVLTDELYFGGSLDALREARNAVELPLLRKDFVIAADQVWEARAAGADAILLIARILDDGEIAGFQALAGELGMDVLVEVHTREELDRVLALGSTLVGVNNRDLATFTTDLSLSIELAAAVPAGVTLVAESGIRGAGDVDLLGRAGVDAVLVGESLMREPDVEAAAAALVGRPRAMGARA
jgi:indole-3-glycerol phosphate synthase